MEALVNPGSSEKADAADVSHLLTMADVLRLRASISPDKPAYTFLPEMGDEVSFTYRQLDSRVREVAAWLQNHGTPGDRVLLLYPPGLEFIVGFFACLYAGMVAVPLKAPRKNRSLSRLHPVIADARARFAFTDEATLNSLSHHTGSLPALDTLRWLGTDTIREPGLPWTDPGVSASDIAFLQYTSGSTSDPKGVIVSHGNLMHNEGAVKQAYGHDHQSTFVGWLPVFHDMGLVGNLLQPLYIGSECYFMAPATFVGNPYRWLKAISDFKAHTSGSPNFGYEHCCNKITPEQKAQLDLSSWKIAFNGAEPVSARTIERFTAEFAECGFAPEAHYPCYGMAEATLFITGSHKMAGASILRVDKSTFEEKRIQVAQPGDTSAYGLVGCGRPWLGMEVLIVHPEKCEPLDDSEIGEIWVRGGSVASGYWNDPESTAQVFEARLTGHTDVTYLRTGDLGFIRDGELYITGRLKDLIIIKGRNYYPQDIEALVHRICPETFDPGYGAAFSVEGSDGSEELVVAYEVRREHRNSPLQDVVATLVHAIASEFCITVREFCVLKPASLMKTSSGKVQRRAMRTAYINDQLDTVYRCIPGTN